MKAFKVQVKLYATLAKNATHPALARRSESKRHGRPVEIELSPGSTLNELVEHLGLPREQVKVIFVNGRARDLDYELLPGDELGIFPPIGGG